MEPALIQIVRLPSPPDELRYKPYFSIRAA